MNDGDNERVGPMLNPPHLGELIREGMEEMGWNVTGTAARLNCDRGTLSRVLNGRAGCVRKYGVGSGRDRLGNRGALDAHAGELRTGAGAPQAKCARPGRERCGRVNGD